MRPLQVVPSGTPAERAEARRRATAWLAGRVLPRVIAGVGLSVGDRPGDGQPGGEGR
jgi:hypothetical protein